MTRSHRSRGPGSGGAGRISASTPRQEGCRYDRDNSRGTLSWPPARGATCSISSLPARERPSSPVRPCGSSVSTSRGAGWPFGAARASPLPRRQGVFWRVLRGRSAPLAGDRLGAYDRPRVAPRRAGAVSGELTEAGGTATHEPRSGDERQRITGSKTEGLPRGEPWPWEAQTWEADTLPAELLPLGAGVVIADRRKTEARPGRAVSYIGAATTFDCWTRSGARGRPDVRRRGAVRRADRGGRGRTAQRDLRGCRMTCPSQPGRCAVVQSVLPRAVANHSQALSLAVLGGMQQGPQGSVERPARLRLAAAIKGISGGEGPNAPARCLDSPRFRCPK